LGETLHDEAGGHGGKQRHSDWEGGAVTKKASNSGDAKTLFRSNLSRARFNKAIGEVADKAFATQPPSVKAAYNDTKKLLENAWKPELQSALKNDVYDAAELRRKIEASILKLPQKGATKPDAGSSRRLDVDPILVAAAFERFAAHRSQTPAGKRTTESEIRTLARLSTKLEKHIESMHQTSRGLLVEENFPAYQLKLLSRTAASVADASKYVITRLADVPFCEQSAGRKVNKRAESVTKIAAAIFERRTGRKPVRIVDRVSGEPGGQFVEWLAELFSLLKIEASADAEARKYHEWISMETTAKK
jgi:hypothetical protein